MYGVCALCAGACVPCVWFTLYVCMCVYLCMVCLVMCFHVFPACVCLSDHARVIVCEFDWVFM